MAALPELDIGKDYDAAALEERARTLWDERGIYRYDPEARGELFSVDTPPPYVSAAHLHVGHAMSYSQAEFVIRFQRMRGRRIYYPMGFDDNGLPTERFVEHKYKINKKKTTRTEFRALCLEETARGIEHYGQLWRAMGLSVDWRQTYSTIDPHCRATAQRSFLDLYRKGRIYRSEEPVLWDTHFETALAQADLDTLERQGVLHDIAFTGEDGAALVISTTRPELLPGCVALYCHPEDARYQHLVGTTARVPITGHEVPVKTDPEVKLDFGTGLMMVCTFGDGEDVKKWKRDGLATRLCITPDGRMSALAGEFAGLPSAACRKQIVKALKEAGHHRGQKNVKQAVSVAERSGTPVEFAMVPQWFIKLLDLKGELLARSGELRWHPPEMKVRLDHWIEGLRYDWNISRQRFYGVPFPLWHCEGCGRVVLADEDALPVDPLEDPCPVASCPSCGGSSFAGEPDVMDTWMTSSLTPLINANWAETAGRDGTMDALYPMTVRVQAFEIIRTWLFYTVLKSHVHTSSLPWRDVMISGWGLNEQGKKISKRDLERYTDKDGYNRYEPYAVIRKYGADALRYWAAGSKLGHDMRYNEKDIRAGRKLVIKLWNAARFVRLQLTGFDPEAPRPPVAARTPEDRWLLAALHATLQRATEGFSDYDYATARQVTDRFFWGTFTDDYLEIIKDRFWNPERYPERARASARATLWESLRVVLALYAPIVPFVTEALWQRVYGPHEDAPSIHVTSWPEPRAELAALAVPEMEVVLAILRAVRWLRTQQRVGATRQLERVTLDTTAADDDIKQRIADMRLSLQAISRARTLVDGDAQHETEVSGVKVDITAAPT